ncbi:DUF938 domain-containing protein [Altericroceibacterium spongiae]|uniref:DUF938 domain-containing protein n=1 Tax=Altericroceibacterium spongiae TaxID=2320269 RepID=A0A420EMJ8_9SPHN|nr:DUF938 domain-containing protein [Altericroceibacterium spongiae]RKF21945.1 DUF938 domain-containing protein [Altericroceibacterium spongiae]
MKRNAPAVARNREPLTAILAEELPDSGMVLEVASGTGEHAVYFAERFPELHWQPSDPDAGARASIVAWQKESELANLALPIALDAGEEEWPECALSAMLCINMVHISRWAASEGLMKAAGRLLPQGAPLILYGPYLEPDVETARSNLEFDASLKARNMEWGLRPIGAMDRLAERNGLERTRRVAMPANNLTLIYRKQGTK